MNLVYNYIELERMRMDDRFDYSLNVDSEIDKRKTYVPSMIIQPFVENSLIHGLFHYQESDGFLRIDVSQDFSGAITCIIQDNGIGRVKSRELNKKSQRKHKSRAYQIINERIEALKQIGYFLSHHTEDLYDKNGDSLGTKVTLKFLTIKLQNR